MLVVFLVVACLAVAGAELYLAFGRTRRETAERTAQRESTERASERLREALEALDTLRADLAGRPDAADLARLTKRTTELAQTQEDLVSALRRYDELAGYMTRVEEQTSRLETSVAEVRRGQGAKIDAALAHHEATLTELRAEAQAALAEARRVAADQNALADTVTAEHARQGAALETALDDARRATDQRVGELAETIRIATLRLNGLTDALRATDARLETLTEDTRATTAHVETLAETVQAADARVDGLAEDARAAAVHVETLAETVQAADARVDDLAGVVRGAEETVGELARVVREDGERLAEAVARARQADEAAEARIEELAAGPRNDTAVRELAAELAELRAASDEHTVRLADALSELRLTRAEQAERLDEAVADLRERVARPERLPELPRRLEELDDPAALEVIRTELVALRGRTDLALDRLDELDAERDRDLERYRDLAQALDAVEDHIAGQRAAGDQEPTTVRGGLVGARPLSHELLSKSYENLVDAVDLRVRMQVPAGESPWRTQYYLAGKNPARLRRDFVALLDGLRGTAADPRRDALHALAVELQAAGDAFAQIGPFILVHVQGALLCGVLTVAESRRFDMDRFLGDPAAAASGLRLLPEQRFRDLSSWPQTA
ncbi:hypothetical protein LO762_27610 [Actinocorallia sp. API 0066]|uniref:hypothetical protein n=1 Tax=Actinocorallia sp. API 0066 TaxID=2896846 RepID=UPI001E5E8B26|nr:hypothetical protein [Actinocorallia sp. API 0066]MCD0452918.1 hypothetical protein [Actinocorallia sp. API 0066]